MTSHIKYLLLFTIVTVLSWFYLMYNIQTTPRAVQPDEPYWMSSAQIIPLLVHHNITDIFWKESVDHANFNGAKFIYGLAHPSSVQEARQLSAIFGSFSVGLLAVLVLLTFDSVAAAFLAALVLAIHPIFVSFATTATNDSLFLFFEIFFFVLLELFLKAKNNPKHSILACALGMCLAELTAIKVTGFLFSGIFLFYVVAANKLLSSREGWKRSLVDVSMFVAVGSIAFLLLHPNFWFPGATGPIEILDDRLRFALTQHRQSGTVPEELLGAFTFLFVGSPLSLLAILSALVIMIRKFEVPFGKELARLCVSAFCIRDVLTQYIVLNDSRYLLPILPLLIIFSSYIFAVATKEKGKLDS